MTDAAADITPARRRRRWRRKTLRHLLPWIVIVAIFVLWELVVQALRIEPFILPAPSAIFASGWQWRWPILDNAWQTLMTTAVGFAIAVVIGLLAGIATVEPELQDVLRALGATRWQIIKKVGLPRSMPYFFASLKVAITFAFVGTIVAETVAANKGIGNLMLVASSRFEVPLAFAGLLVTSVMGIGMYLVCAYLERRMTGWAMRGIDATRPAMG